MKYSELCNSGAIDTDKRAFLVDGKMTAITIRIPMNLKEAAVESATLKGLSFSAFVRACLLDNLVREDH